MTSVEFIHKVRLLKNSWRRGLLTDQQFHAGMADLRAVYVSRNSR